MPIRVIKDEQGKILYTIYKTRIVKFIDSRNKVLRSDYLTSSYINQGVSGLINSRLVDEYVVHDISKSYASLELAVRSISNENGVCKYSENGRPFLTFSPGSLSISGGKLKYSVFQGQQGYTPSGTFDFKYPYFKGVSDQNKVWLDQYGAYALQFIFKDHQNGNQTRMLSSKGFYSSKDINFFELFRNACLNMESVITIAKDDRLYSYDVTLIDGFRASYKYYVNKTYCPQA